MKDIREKIDRYLDERMSHDEEQEFFRYLRSAELPEEFHEERELILQMAAMQEPPPPPADMEERLTAMIDNLAQKSDAPVKRVFTLKLRHVWRAAAVVAIVAATGLAIVQHERNKYDAFIAARDKDTFTTAEEALPHANAILRNLATGTKSTRNSVAETGNDIKKLSIIIKRNQ